MNQTPAPGMYDQLAAADGGPSEQDIAFVRTYVATGELPAELLLSLRDPARLAEREQAKALLRERDWPNLGRYRDANSAQAGAPVRAVFFGDSISEMWPYGDPILFSRGVLCRGISGQTTMQMLPRFMGDVVQLRPVCVHLMGGLNDIAGNTGPTTLRDYQNNIEAMITLALAHGIRVILGSLTPAAYFTWQPGIDPRPRIAQINTWLRGVAEQRGLVYADYHAALAAADGAMGEGLARDGLHPNAAGYAAMRPVALEALETAA